MSTYEVTLVEIEHPDHRDGMRFTVLVDRPRKRDAVRGFRDRFVVYGVRLVSSVRRPG
jgi:hypothetical protein